MRDRDLLLSLGDGVEKHVLHSGKQALSAHTPEYREDVRGMMKLTTRLLSIRDRHIEKNRWVQLGTTGLVINKSYCQQPDPCSLSVTRTM